MKFDFQLEIPYYDDMAPDTKSCDELALLVLNDATGKRVNMTNYTEKDINRCARQLILNGFLKGSVMDFDKCVWSRITRRGKFLLEIMTRKS
ncbi:MAG: hypothetical protein HW421_1914 [Ignavibacteria bacterium]|nr:hypothetical protein [Ignavibacteria bacterium]